MQNVVRLEEYRRSRASRGVSSSGRSRAKSPRADTRPPEAPRYFCLSCDCDQFKLYASGTIHCAGCGALIRNVLATANPEH